MAINNEQKTFKFVV